MTLPQFNQLPDASATQSPLNECEGTLWVISPKAATNFCANPSFETDTNNWTVDAGGTITRVSDPWSGAYGLSWAAVPGSYLRYGVSSQISMPRQRYYAVSFYCYSATANSDTAVTVEVYNTTLGTVLSSYTQKITTSWSRVVSVFYTFIISTNIFAVRISCNQSATIVLDAVQIEQTTGTTASTYFDGATETVISNSQITSPQYAWQGKAHASTSIRSVTAANGGLPINLQNELGFTIVGVIGADNPAPNNQIVSYNATDGATLQDILIPPRQVTFVGRISSTDKTSLARKVSTFLQYFSRDTVSIRQPKYFIFQFKNNRESIGQPMYFSGVVMNTANVPLSNDLAYTVSITLNMIDPFFYGHSDGVAQQMPSLNSTTGGLSYIPDFTQKTGTFTSFAQALGDVNGVVRAMVTAPDGTIYFGGDFTTVGGSAISYIGKLQIFVDSNTYSISALTGALNGPVYALAITPDGADLWVGGTFTTANAVATNRIARYTIATNTWATFGAGTGGGVNAGVYAISINPKRFTTSGSGYSYQVFIGGTFTASTGAVNMYRLAVTSQTANAWTALGTGSGMNGDVLAVAYNPNLDYLYIGGAFTTSQGGTANAYTGICYINMSTPGTTVAFYTGVSGGNVNCIYTSITDNSLYIGGSFTSTFAGATLNRVAQYNGVVWYQLDTGFSDGTVYGITPYRNGLSIIGSFINKGLYTQLNWGIVWYNGQILLPVALNATQKGFASQAVSGDGTLYLGINYGGNGYSDSTISSGLVIQKNYNGTAAAPIVVQSYIDDVLFIGGMIFQVQNATQQTAISFKQLPVTYKEILQVDTKYGTIKSDILGNQLRYLLGSGLTNLKVMPKNNYLVFWGLNNTAARAVYISIYWRKTYNTLFDGVNAT
jgi:hypothetical protein